MSISTPYPRIDRSPGSPRPTFVFGISGATWRMIDPLLSAGRLPVLAHLISRGSRATLCSTRAVGDKHFRPQIAWPTIATGVSPETHGVTRFYHTADDCLAPTIWDHFNSAGLKVGLFGWPIIWPVKPVNGFIIPGYDGRDPTTFPPHYCFLRQLDLRQQAANGSGGRLALARNLLRGGVKPATFARLAAAAINIKLRAPRELRPLLVRRARLDISTDIFLKLFRTHAPDFAAFVTFLVDYAQHRFWIFQEPQAFPDAPKIIPAALKNAVTNAYIAADRALGRIIRHLDPSTTIAVVSEHGMAAEPHSTEIGPSHYILRPARLKELVELDPATPAVPVARWIALRPTAEQIDDIANRLRAVRIDGTDQPLFQVHLYRDEIIVKLALYRESLPGREELETLKIQYRDRTFPFTWLAERFGRRRSAMHAEEGILVLAGRGIRHADLGRCNLVDVAPTLLHATGLNPTSCGQEGRVLDVFDSL